MTTFLTYFTVVLAVIGLVQIVRIFELAAKLKGEQNLDEISDKENRFNAVANACSWYELCFVVCSLLL